MIYFKEKFWQKPNRYIVFVIDIKSLNELKKGFCVDIITEDGLQAEIDFNILAAFNDYKLFLSRPKSNLLCAISHKSINFIFIGILRLILIQC